jgi:hypothetical protein
LVSGATAWVGAFRDARIPATDEYLKPIAATAEPTPGSHGRSRPERNDQRVATAAVVLALVKTTRADYMRLERHCESVRTDSRVTDRDPKLTACSCSSLCTR